MEGARNALLLCGGTFQLEPVAAVGQPPTEQGDWNRGYECWPEWQEQVGRYAQDGENSPKNLLFHRVTLALAQRINHSATVESEERDILPGTER